MVNFQIYIYLAKLILAFCPPLKVIPLSPTIVSSPSGKYSRSFFSAQTSITYLKIILVNCTLNCMLLYNVNPY